jgi:hypothetical protein
VETGSLKRQSGPCYSRGQLEYIGIRGQGRQKTNKTIQSFSQRRGRDGPRGTSERELRGITSMAWLGQQMCTLGADTFTAY